MPIRPRPTLGVIMVLLAALFFAVNGSISKTILKAGIAAHDLATFRAIGGCLGLLLLGVLLRPGLPRFRVKASELPLLIVYGITGFFAVPMLYFVGISRLPVGIALLFEFTAPLFVALWARFGQRQQVRPRLWIGFALSLTGLAIVAEVWGNLKLDALGVSASLLAAVLLAVYFILGARGVASRDSISLTGWAFGFSALAGLITRGVGGRLPDWHALTGQTQGGIAVWVFCGYLLILGTIVPYLLIVGSLRHLPATSVGILGMIEPVLASGVAWIALGERLNAAQLLGGAVLLAGVVLAETARVPVGQNEAHAPTEDSVVASQRDSSPATT